MLIFTGVCVLVTLIFRADVNAQAGAYATGVLALMTSAAFAVMLSAFAKRQLWAALGFGLVTAVFIYTATVTVLSDLDGLVIAAFFVAAIVVVSLISRVFRSTELRVERVQADPRPRRLSGSWPWVRSAWLPTTATLAALSVHAKAGTDASAHPPTHP